MPPNFYAILSDFFIKGHDLNYIAATYESSWFEVAEVLDSDLARKYMRSAIRVQRIRAAGLNIRSRIAAIQTLESTIMDRRDSSHSSIESRRRAATAILSGTTPRGRSAGQPRAAARPKPSHLSPTPETSVSEPAKQPAPPPQSAARNSTKKSAPKPTRGNPLKSTRTHARLAPLPHKTSKTTPKLRSTPSRQPARQSRRLQNSS
jgi:hypothetical protein